MGKDNLDFSAKPGSGLDAQSSVAVSFNIAALFLFGSASKGKPTNHLHRDADECDCDAKNVNPHIVGERSNMGTDHRSKDQEWCCDYHP